MRLSYERIKKTIPAFNERELTEQDFSILADAHEIDVCEMTLRRRGYHVWNDKNDYIFIKKSLMGVKWRETAFHELFHALLSAPIETMRDKQQLEAVCLSLIALIPLPLMRDYQFLEENPTRYARRLFKEREKVYFLYGV